MNNLSEEQVKIMLELLAERKNNPPPIEVASARDILNKFTGGSRQPQTATTGIRG